MAQLSHEDYRVVSVDQLDEAKLDQFLRRVFGDVRGEFMHSYGSWWYHGNQNRLAVVRNDEIAAYCGLIPTKCLINAVEYPAKWWVDLVVAPEFRGRGLQTLLDREVREAGDLKLGFPNEVAAEIHRKHGWGIRDDCRFLMLPLVPPKMRAIRNATGTRGRFLRFAAQLVKPVTAIVRKRLGSYEPLTAREMESLDPELLASVYGKYRSKLGVITTSRDTDSILWRYHTSPYRSELVFYVAGPPQSPDHYVVLRCVRDKGVISARILDVFGDFGDTDGLRDILRLAVRDAVRRGACQIAALASEPRVYSTLRSIGFPITGKVRFCWHSKSQEIMESLATCKYHWTMADSDHDAPA